MIPINELRIGVIVLYENTYHKVGPQDFDYGGNCNVFEPIPLTPELLQALGFERDNGMMSWEKEEVVIAYETLAGFFRLYPRTNPIKYLHQLQNLFHSLTGQELTLPESLHP